MGGPQGALVDGGGGRGGREQSTGWAGSMAVPPPGQGTMGPMCVVAEQAAPSGTHHAPLLGTLGVARDGLGHLVACQQVVHKGEVAGREVGLRVGGWGRRMTGWREQDQAQSWLLAALNSGADLALPVVSRPPCPARPPRTLKIELVTAHAGVLAICGGVGEWRLSGGDGMGGGGSREQGRAGAALPANAGERAGSKPASHAPQAAESQLHLDDHGTCKRESGAAGSQCVRDSRGGWGWLQRRHRQRQPAAAALPQCDPLTKLGLDGDRGERVLQSCVQ